MANTEMKSFFDRLAPSWSNCPEEYEVREKIVSLADCGEHGVIADIGCGRGVMFEHLLKTNPKSLVALDISTEMIDCAKSTFDDGRITYVNDDLFEAELPVFDAVMVYNAYPHFLDKRAFCEKLAKHIRKDGTLVIAHGRCKSAINGTHSGKTVSTLSVPLEDAGQEATKFSSHFTPAALIDNDEFYFIKLVRNDA